MTETPLVSIGLPVYNGSRYLREAIEDFLAQSFSDFELILSDNASTDETEAICLEYAAREQRIRYVRNETNIGALPNSNQTIELAQGEYFCLAAHDDRHAPDFLEKLVDALETNSEAGLAYGRCEYIDRDGEALQKVGDQQLFATPDGHAVDYDQQLEKQLSDDPVERFRAVLQTNDLNGPIHGLFRLDALKQTGGHQFHGSDRLVVGHAALQGPLVFVDEPLFSFRVHPNSTFFLTREEWAERETGTTDADSSLGTFKSFGNMWRATNQPQLSTAQSLRAKGAVLGYLVRPAAMKRALLPGTDNYFGWKKWPWQREVGPPVAFRGTSLVSNDPKSPQHA